MPRSIHVAAASLALLAAAPACTQTPQPSPTTAPVVSLPAPEPAAAPGPTAASASAPTSAPVATTPEPSATPRTEASTGGRDHGPATVDARFRACKADADCAVVPREGCCRNGWNEAVNAAQKDAYRQANACTATPRPMCPMFQVRDTRVARCDAPSHLCAMVQP